MLWLLTLGIIAVMLYLGWVPTFRYEGLLGRRRLELAYRDEEPVVYWLKIATLCAFAAWLWFRDK
ncbi:MAG: hypothetical protein KF774_20445 [Planctomyces sp.]|nr:hypothetical protein [Planctomyces sp.]